MYSGDSSYRGAKNKNSADIKHNDLKDHKNCIINHVYGRAGTNTFHTVATQMGKVRPYMKTPTRTILYQGKPCTPKYCFVKTKR